MTRAELIAALRAAADDYRRTQDKLLAEYAEGYRELRVVELEGAE